MMLYAAAELSHHIQLHATAETSNTSNKIILDTAAEQSHKSIL